MSLISPDRFQSTPPCGGDGPASPIQGGGRISIHAPLRGRLGHCRQDSLEAGISIHAPLRGRPQGEKGGSQWLCDFNPRPLAGATGGKDLQAHEVYISIHAPLRGRRKAGRSRASLLIFQSTPPCGGDSPAACRLWSLPISIHAPLRGRLYSSSCSSSKQHFNPRPLAGATLPAGGLPGPHGYFNPRPLAGATKRGPDHGPVVLISIHAPLRGRLIWRASWTAT